MSAYFIDSIEVRQLWGYKSFSLKFLRDVNILIGPNASGKTTILNLLRYTLTADVYNLAEIKFKELTVKLKQFQGPSSRTIRVRPNENGFTFSISGKKYEVEIEDSKRKIYYAPSGRILRRGSSKPRELVDLLNNLVPSVWLPISRRLPIHDEEDEYRMRQFPELESVDVRLRELLQGLARYRLELDSKLSERYKVFEKQVLQLILYNKRYDRIGSFRLDSPTPNEKNQLISAFQAAGLLDPQMRKRIDEHFEAAEEAILRLSRDSKSEQGPPSLDRDFLQDLFIVPLIGRTRSIIQSAKELEEDRESLFAPLRKYERIVGDFITEKEIRVTDSGILSIKLPSTSNGIPSSLLSSGEKQILILLTQALLWEDKPVVYIADEPELSLHVTWQEKLLESLKRLGGLIQIIVATHSPDIVGPFVDHIIDLGSQE